MCRPGGGSSCVVDNSSAANRAGREGQMGSGVEVIRRSERRLPEQATPGMQREEAFAGEDTWIGTVRTEPGIETGWHHHGTYESYIYVLAGTARMEFGAQGG